ncbi:MAG: hypothetical protein E7439_01255 [Ruminococcaceae bacterium]|nr:hypothetical protein [Oscillospiraceae bacterium]
MAIPVYLALTAAEFRRCTALPPHCAWLSCLFSPYGRGLSNVPKQLPPNALLILSDRTPVCGHDGELIKAQLEEAISALNCCGLLLDFQRPGCPEAQKIAACLTKLPCPVAVSASYAKELDCPVFLPPVPLDVPLKEYVQPWAGRDIWLEAATQNASIMLTAQGASYKEDYEEAPLSHIDAALHCHYHVQPGQEEAIFYLRRTREDLDALLAEAETFGITRAVGLFQELG